MHISQTTVEEALRFSARLRLPTTVGAGTRGAFVEEVRAGTERQGRDCALPPLSAFTPH